MKTRMTCAVLLGLVSLGALAACGGDEGGVGDFPVGTYQVTSDSGVEGIVEFGDDGTFSMTEGEAQWTAGDFSVKGDELTFVTDSFCDATYVPDSPTYTWSLDGDTLSLTPKDDDICVERVNLLDNGLTRSSG